MSSTRNKTTVEIFSASVEWNSYGDKASVVLDTDLGYFSYRPAITAEQMEKLVERLNPTKGEGSKIADLTLEYWHFSF